MDREEFRQMSSIIIYCMYQREVEAVTSFLQNQGANAVSYHGGMDKGK